MGFIFVLFLPGGGRYGEGRYEKKMLVSTFHDTPWELVDAVKRRLLLPKSGSGRYMMVHLLYAPRWVPPSHFEPTLRELRSLPGARRVEVEERGIALKDGHPCRKLLFRVFFDGVRTRL